MCSYRLFTLLSLHCVPNCDQRDGTHSTFFININEKAVVKKVFGKNDASYKSAHLQVNGVRINSHTDLDPKAF